jgi:hypothetical protein
MTPAGKGCEAFKRVLTRYPIRLDGYLRRLIALSLFAPTAIRMPKAAISRTAR